MDQEMKENIRKLTDDLLFGNKGGRQAALFFKKTAEKGENISEFIEDLIEAYLDCNNVTIMQPIADALTIHFLNTKEMKNLNTLLQREKFRYYILAALRGAVENGFDISPAIPLVIDAIGKSSTENMDIRHVLVSYIKKDKEKLSEVVELMCKKQYSRFYIPDLLDELVMRAKIDISPVLTTLATLLSESNSNVRYDVAGTFRVAAEGMIDLSSVIPTLEKALSDKKKEVRERAAYSITYFYVNKKKQEEWTQVVDRLLTHKNDDVRSGATWALSVSLVSRKRDNSAVVSRIAKMLTDKNQEVRKDAVRALKEAERKGLKIQADIPTIHSLVQVLDDDDKKAIVAEYLYSFIGKNNKNAERLLNQIKKSIDKKNQTIDKLIKVCQEVMKNEHVKACSICKHIPRSKSYSHILDLPKELDKLTPKIIKKSEDFITSCPQCGNYYTYSYSIEWDVISADETFSIKRLSPTEALKKFSGKALQSLKKNYDQIIKNMIKNLTHINQNVRQDAAWSLTLHYIENENLEKIDELLLQNPDEYVRLDTVDTLKEAVFKSLDISPLVSTLRKLLSDENERLRGSSSSVLSRHYISKKHWEKIGELLKNEDVYVKASVLYNLFCSTRDGIDISAFIPTLRTLIAHENETVRMYARWALEETAKLGLDTASTIQAYIEQLSHKNPEVRKDAVSSLKEAAREGQDISSAIPILVKLLADKDAGWRANEALRIAAVRGLDISVAIPALAEALSDDNCRYKNDALWTLETALRNGIDISPAIPALSELLSDTRLTQSVVTLLNTAAEKGIDLSSAIPALREVSSNDDDGFNREQATEALTRQYIQEKQWKKIEELLKHKRKDVRATSCRILGEVASQVDISPVIPPIVENHSHKYWYLRDCVFRTLFEFAKQNEKNARLVLDQIKKSNFKENKEVKELIEKCEKILK